MMWEKNLEVASLEQTIEHSTGVTEMLIKSVVVVSEGELSETGASS